MTKKTKFILSSLLITIPVLATSVGLLASSKNSDSQSANNSFIKYYNDLSLYNNFEYEGVKDINCKNYDYSHNTDSHGVKTASRYCFFIEENEKFDLRPSILRFQQFSEDDGDLSGFYESYHFKETTNQKIIDFFVFLDTNYYLPFIYKNIDVLPDLKVNKRPVKNLLYYKPKYLLEFVNDQNFLDLLFDKGIYNKEFVNQNEYNKAAQNERYDELKVVWESLSSFIKVNSKLIAEIQLLNYQLQNTLINEQEYKRNAYLIIAKYKNDINTFLSSFTTKEKTNTINEHKWASSLINKKQDLQNNIEFLRKLASNPFIELIYDYANNYFNPKTKDFFDPNLLFSIDNTHNHFKFSSYSTLYSYIIKVWSAKELLTHIFIPPKKDIVERNYNDMYRDEIYQRSVKYSNNTYDYNVANEMLLLLEQNNLGTEYNELKNNLNSNINNYNNEMNNLKQSFNSFIKDNYNFLINETYIINKKDQNKQEVLDNFIDDKIFKKITSMNLYFIDLLEFLIKLGWNEIVEINIDEFKIELNKKLFNTNN